MDAPPPSFPSSSPTPPPLYSPLILTRAGLICRRTCDSPKVWQGGVQWLYGGGSSLLQTRHCHSLTGPSIKDLSTAGWIMLSGTLTRLGKVQPQIIVRRVVPTWSWLTDVSELGPLQLSGTSFGFPLNHPPAPASIASLSISAISPPSQGIRLSLLILPPIDAPASPLSPSPPWSSWSLPEASDVPASNEDWSLPSITPLTIPIKTDPTCLICFLELPHSLGWTVDVDSEPHVVLKVIKVVTHQLSEDMVLLDQLMLQILDITFGRVELLLQGLNLAKLFSLHDHCIVCVVHSIFSLLKSISYGNSLEYQYYTYCHLDIGHGMIKTSTNDTDQLLTSVNDFQPWTLVVTLVPFLGAMTHLSGIVGSEGNMLEMAMSGNGPVSMKSWRDKPSKVCWEQPGPFAAWYMSLARGYAPHGSLQAVQVFLWLYRALNHLKASVLV